MSFRNGDKSRENRLRRARIAMRDKVRQLRNAPTYKDTSKPAAK